MLPDNSTFFGLSGLTLFTGLGAVLLGMFAVSRERGSRLSICLALLASAMAVWMLSYSHLYAATNESDALRWVRLGYVGVPFLPVLMYLFTIQGVHASEGQSRILRGGWILAAFFSLNAVATDALIAGLHRYSWGYYPFYGWMGIPFQVYFCFFLGLSLYTLWAEWRAAEPGIQKRRVRALTISFGVVVLGSVDFLPKYGVDVYPVGFLFVGVFLAACVYIIQRYRLVDITASFAASEITSTMNDALIVCDAAGRIRVTNPAATSILHYPQEELHGMVSESLAPSDLEARNRWRSVLDQAGARDEEVELCTKQGEPVAVSVSSAVLRDPNGVVAGTVIIARDIRARKRTEAELRDREERYRSLFEQNPDAVYSLDLEGRFVSVNQTCSLVAGYPLEALVGMSYRSLIAPEDAERTDAHFERATRGEHQTCDLAIRAAGHRRFDLNVTMIPILVNGATVGVYGIAKDITEQKHAREALAHRTAQLERSNQELEQFAYVASHDLQEPLRKIQAFGDRLKSRYSDALGDAGRDYLERMQGAASRMQTLIQDLLAFSRVATKPQPFQRLDMAAIADEVVSDLEARVQQTGGRVELHDLPTVEADPLQVRQLLQNLVGNALKFHRPDVPPLVVVRGRPLDASHGTPAAPWVELTVSDNGIGFEEKYLDRIFAPFQRLHGRGDYEGTGMGLAICRKIVDRHAGTITARSVPGEGSTFVITLPIHHPEMNN